MVPHWLYIDLQRKESNLRGLEVRFPQERSGRAHRHHSSSAVQLLSVGLPGYSLCYPLLVVLMSEVEYCH